MSRQPKGRRLISREEAERLLFGNSAPAESNLTPDAPARERFEQLFGPERLADRWRRLLEKARTRRKS